MSEPHAQSPAADVRSFLPRPGEPVEEYAARLRALHHDLTLVLDAVERGLAAAERQPEPVEARASRRPHRSPPPSEPLTSTAPGAARVEVIPAPETARGPEAEDERVWSGPLEPGGLASQPGRRAPWGEGAPAGGEPAAPSPERSPRAGVPPLLVAATIVGWLVVIALALVLAFA